MELYEIWTSLVYILSFKPARATLEKALTFKKFTNNLNNLQVLEIRKISFDVPKAVSEDGLL